jgi:hypothetical protein
VIKIDEEVFLEQPEMRRKKFQYNHRIHYGYVFLAGDQLYDVILGHIPDKKTFDRIGYSMPPGIQFPHNGLCEVYFDTFDGMEGLADFRHVKFNGFGSAVVLQNVSLALIAHYQTFDIGGFVFQAASGEVVDFGRPTPLEETYDYMLGLKSEPRYNVRTGLQKKAPRALLPEDINSFKIVTEGRACYVVL